MSFKDLKTLIDTEGFTQKNSFDVNSMKCVTKTEAINALNIQTAPLDGLDSNQLVWRNSLIKTSAPVDNPPTAPSSIISYISQVGNNSIVFEASGASDDIGIAGYEWRLDVQSDGGAWQQIRNGFASTSNTYFDITHSDLGYSKTYRYWIRTQDTAGQWSAWVFKDQATGAAPVVPVDGYPDDTISMCLGESVKLSGLYVYESYADFEYVNWQKESDPNFSAYGEFLTDSPTRTTRYGITRKPLVGSTSIVYITVQVVNC